MKEVYISVDIEAAGPVPGEYSMLSIGATVVGDPEASFYAELKPLNDNAVPEALAVSKLNMTKLAETGQEPRAVMLEFRDWVQASTTGCKSVFVISTRASTGLS
jgi:ribonuclease T